MIFNMLKSFNWLDIIILIIIFRIFYISIKGGFTTEFFKFFGVLTSIYLSMHYNTGLSDFISSKLNIEDKMPLGFLDFILFVILALAGYFIFVLVRNAVNNLVKIEAVSVLNKWGGLILGALRSVLLAGLVSFALAISSVPYLKNSVMNSYLGPRVLAVAVNTYSTIWNNLFSKFAAGEKYNTVVSNVLDEAPSK
ncbi:MAG: CvpA family protein [Candidatus Omnitrophota bacterium]|nr:CvpA family protein [Candidatus Omnitrophota bacterium]MDD5665563.1 CvpA family protein [Candidatus Omnitrophota bacterium]